MTEPLKPGTPAQVGSVTGVDRMDTADRASQHPTTKLELLMIETRNATGRDPRGGGHALVARPRVILQMLIDLGPLMREHVRLHRPIVIGSSTGDLVGHWKDVPILVRCNVRDDRVYCLPLDQIPLDEMPDRATAGRLRIAAWNGKLPQLREQG